MHSQSVTWKACRTRQMWKGKNTMEICKQANCHLFDFAKIDLVRKLIYINRKNQAQYGSAWVTRSYCALHCSKQEVVQKV